MYINTAECGVLTPMESAQKPPRGRFHWVPRMVVNHRGLKTGAETDGRLLDVRARFSRGWNLVDFLVYVIGYL